MGAPLSGIPFADRRKSFASVADVAAWRLCLGCGACQAVCPRGNITLHDFETEGLRPLVNDTDVCAGCSLCLEVCPGFENDRRPLLEAPHLDPDFLRAFGPVLEAWEGHAADPELRYRGASGGAMTALTLYCLEREGMSGVLEAGEDPDDPARNTVRLSRSRVELLACTGSRYAPAAVCSGLRLVADAPAPCVVVGKPAEMAALYKAQAVWPALRSRVGLSVSFLCAGTPATRGTLDLLARAGLQPGDVDAIRYRGLGWPGSFAVRRKGGRVFEPLFSYYESWEFLSAYRPLPVHLNPDVSGEYADVSCGDPWYRDVAAHAPGLSIVLVRTQRGRELVARARAAGYLSLQRLPVPAESVIRSQRARNKRGAVWGRTVILRALGIPVTRLRGFSLFRDWLGIPFREKLRSTVGTVQRVLVRRYFLPRPLHAGLRHGPALTDQSASRASPAPPPVRRC